MKKHLNFNSQSECKTVSRVKNIFSEILHINKNCIQLDDTFFNLGGDSLKLVIFTEKIFNYFNIEIDIRFLFKKNSVSDITKLINFFLAHPKFCTSYTKSQIANNLTKLSFEQQQIWIAHNASIYKNLYNVPLFIEIKGKLDINKLFNALEKIVLQIETFRSCIITSSGFPEIKTYNFVPLNFEIIKCTEHQLEDTFNKIKLEPFDLSIAPLYRLKLVKTKNRYFLCCVFHHLIIDSHSLNTFSSLLSNLYNTSELTFKSNQYCDYIANQHAMLSNRSSKKINNFWKKYIDKNELILNFPRINQYNGINDSSAKKTSLSFNLNTKLCKNVKKFTNENNITDFPYFYSIFSIIISRYINQNDFLIALPVSTRIKGSYANTLGLFVNLLPFRNSINNDDSFLSYVINISRTLIELYKNSYISHSAIQKICELNSEEFNPALSIAFSLDYESTPIFKNIETNLVPTSYVGNKFDLTFFVKNSDNFTRVLIEFNPKIFSEEVINSIYHSFCYITEFVLSNRHTKLSNIPLVAQNKLPYSKTVFRDNHKTILDIFDRSANKHSTKVAIEHDNNVITYQELIYKANQFANYLHQSGYKPGDRIAILMKHSIELIICILGVLKARCVYVPIHPTSPLDRISFMTKQSKAKSILTDDGNDLGIENLKSHQVNEIFDQIDNYSKIFSTKYCDIDLAYIIFTSGSTGQPKGVMVNHNNLNNLFSKTDKNFDFNSDDCWLLFHSYSFDFSVWEIFGALLHGAKLIIPNEKLIRSPGYLYRLILDKKITILNQTPSAFSLFYAEAIKQLYDYKLPLRYIIFGGEAINNQTILNWIHYISTKLNS
jgi:fengycin family lipopeptide synthetase B